MQNPIVLTNNSEPQPDLVILKYRPDFYANEHHKPEDSLPVIISRENPSNSSSLQIREIKNLFRRLF